jgi:type I restriction enzyme S subunit
METSHVISNISILANSAHRIRYLRDFILTQAMSGAFSESKPDSWRITTLGAEVEIIRGITFPASAKYREPAEQRIVCLRTTNVQDQVDWSDLLYVPEGYVKNQDQYIRKNDILISMANSKELVGKVSRVDRDDIRCTLGGFISAIRCRDKILPEFLMLLLRTPLTRERIIDSSTQTTNIANISLGRLRPLEIKLPSIDVQREIVQGVGQFLNLCDELESTLAKHNEVSTAARKSAVDAISAAQSHEEFETAWNRIQQNWGVIAGTSDSINELRGLILTLATRGLLVKQILSEPRPQFKSVTNPRQIPGNWIWCELEAISQYGGNGSVIPESIPKESWILDLEDIEKKTSKLLVRSFAADRKTSSNKTPFNAGDVLYGKLRPYLDKVLVADMSGFCTTEIVPIQPMVGLDPNWLRICLKRPEFIKKVTDLSYGTKMPRLGTNDAKKSVHPIPPFEEQRRVVERVVQLMQICDQLERELILAGDLAEKFSRSIVSASG